MVRHLRKGQIGHLEHAERWGEGDDELPKSKQAGAKRK
jgi:hypothetical protein